MKRVLTLALFIHSFAYGQITYQSSDYASIGDTFVISQSTAIGGHDFSLTGANYTWNYDSLIIVSQNREEILDPSNTGYYTTFMAACILGGGGSLWL